MSVVSVNTWEIRCDFCDRKETVTTTARSYPPRVPEPWQVITIKRSDKFDTTRDACPECAKGLDKILWW